MEKQKNHTIYSFNSLIDILQSKKIIDHDTFIDNILYREERKYYNTNIWIDELTNQIIKTQSKILGIVQSFPNFIVYLKNGVRAEDIDKINNLQYENFIDLLSIQLFYRIEYKDYISQAAEYIKDTYGYDFKIEDSGETHFKIIIYIIKGFDIIVTKSL